ncbi:hypothetical protein ACQUFY_10960 [Robbsia andropogonis]|uniref:hypothetical protein n=1 Tax=Robbsia andropogonis TaxID=28092 RepID=UPI003D1BE935
MNIHIIDWSKYGKGVRSPAWTLEFGGDGSRLVCRATFPINEWDAVKTQVEAQLAYWKMEKENEEGI